MMNRGDFQQSRRAIGPTELRTPVPRQARTSAYPLSTERELAGAPQPSAMFIDDLSQPRVRSAKLEAVVYAG